VLHLVSIRLFSTRTDIYLSLTPQTACAMSHPDSKLGALLAGHFHAEALLSRIHPLARTRTPAGRDRREIPDIDVLILLQLFEIWNDLTVDHL